MNGLFLTLPFHRNSKVIKLTNLNFPFLGKTMTYTISSFHVGKNESCIGLAFSL